METALYPLDLYDSFGQYRGDRFFSNHVDAWDAVQRWSPTVRGNRHRDWAARDLIRGSALREPANWPYRMLARSEHPYLESHDEANADISRSQAFLFVYYQGLLRQVDYGDGDSVASSLVNCPPNLFQINPAQLDNVRSCKRNKRCPFCLARSAYSVYERIESASQARSQAFLSLVSLTERLSAMELLCF